ncbi:MAG: redox-regulated ATPase YchF [Alphaproteobacteria bacterium]
MGFKCGIVGLPNVGKSTLFNALTSAAQAAVGNYPFCTVEPNVGRVPVPDEALDAVARLARSAAIVPTFLEVVDIAGLVRGASQGEGLGNRFLANIREVDAIIHVVRCFEDDGVTHVEGGVDPIRDIELIETELMIADLESVGRQLDAATKKARGGDKEAKASLAMLEKVKAALDAGRPARGVALDDEACADPAYRQLLTAKPVLYVANVDEASAASGNAQSARVAERARQEGAELVVISAAIEAEIAGLKEAGEKREFLDSLGLKEPGLDRVIRAGYRLLGLIRFLTAGPKEARAWTIPIGATAREAAGTIHSDFAKGFICAETIALDDYLALGGEQAAKEKGRMRQEGRDYVVKDGDVLLFRFNV